MIERLLNDLSSINYWASIIIPVLLGILFWLIGRSWDYIKSIGKEELSNFIGEFNGYNWSTVDGSKIIIESKVSISKNMFGVLKVEFTYPKERKIVKGYAYAKGSAIYFKLKWNRSDELIIFSNPESRPFITIKGIFLTTAVHFYPYAGIQVLSRNILSQEEQNSYLGANSALIVEPNKENIEFIN